MVSTIIRSIRRSEWVWRFRLLETETDKLHSDTQDYSLKLGWYSKCKAGSETKLNDALKSTVDWFLKDQMRLKEEAYNIIH
jgi:hypothetical protein